MAQSAATGGFDPGRLADDVALRTQWEPLFPSHANFQIYQWEKLDAQRARFRPTDGLRLFCGVFAAFGVLMLVSACVPGFSGAQGGSSSVGGLFGILFLVGPVMLYVGAYPPITFDKSAGTMSRVQPWMTDPVPLDLKRVHAVQLLPRARVYDNAHDNAAHYRQTLVASWELNLVLEDAEREHLVGHFAWSTALSEARVLSSFLGKPLWNAAEDN